MIVTEPANFLEAMIDCVNRDDVLASVTSQKANEMIHDLTGGNDVWIGLTDFHDEGEFTWVDGSKSSFENWLDKPRQPDNDGGKEHCTQMMSDGNWNDAPCNNKYQYVCQYTTATVSSEIIGKWKSLDDLFC